MRPRRAFAFAFPLGVVLAALGACLDFTPITDVPALDASTDLGIDTSSAPSTAACLVCLGGTTPDAGGDAGSGASDGGDAGDGESADAAPAPPAHVPGACEAQLAACHAEPKCEVMFLCAIPLGCFAPEANVVGCLTICGAQAGISEVTDPAVKPFTDLYTCTTQQCVGPCGTPASDK